MGVAGGWLSVVPTFRPSEETVNLIRVLAASGPVVVSDDASPCTSDRALSTIAEVPEVTLIRNARNHGIGRGLNQGLADARARNLRWLLAVDQDSQLEEAYAATLAEFADSLVSSGVKVGAIGAGQVLDASGPVMYPTRIDRHGGVDVTVTEEVLQSGTLWSVPALTHVGGFDESLGMDAVDAAACLALRAQGFVIALHPSLAFEHRIEGAQQLNLLGRKVMVTGHSAARRRAIVRNRLRLFPREFAQSPVHALRTLRRSAVNFVAVPFRRKS